MIQKYHDPILTVINEKGASGVNVIAQLTGIPLSTVQKYLTTQQKYFRKTQDRKWDLPEKVTTDISNNSHTLVVTGIENSFLLFKSELDALINLVDNSLIQIEQLKRVVQNKPTPVAENTINPRLKNLQEKMDNLPRIIKSKKENIPKELLEILLNTNWTDFTLDMGANYLNDVVEPALYSLIIGESDYLDEDLLNQIKEYQS